MPTFSEALSVWVRVALNSFGGPAGQIAVVHRIIVEEKKWLDEPRFLHALNYCMLIPGPEAQQLVTYIGWLLHGVRGGLVAGALFILPGFVSILLLSLLYVHLQGPVALGGLYGLKAAVLAVVLEAVVRIGKRVLKTPAMYGVAIAAFLLIYLLDVPFPLIVVGAGLLGFVGARVAPSAWAVIKLHAGAGGGGRPPAGYLPKTIALWLGLWWAPVLALLVTVGPEHIFVRIGLFFSQAAMVSFGGAYALLGWIAQHAVEDQGWLTAGEMMDGLGMAETTPGPLIQVVQFVGFLAAYREPGSLSPTLAAILASVLTTWVTFMPSFLWIFAGAPYIEGLRANHNLTAALSAITAAIVGVVLNLAVWFGLHVLFTAHDGWPVLSSFDPFAAIIALLSAVALLRLHWPLWGVLLGAVGAGLARSLFAYV